MTPPTPSRVDLESRINVLFVMIHMNMGGTERLIFNLVRHLDRRIFAPSVAWFVEDRPLPEFEALGVPLFHVPKRDRIDWRAMRHLARIIREHRIDIVNAHHFMPFVYSYYGARIANRAGLVYTEHSEADVLRVPRKWQVIGRQMLRTSHGAIGISPKVTEVLTQHFAVSPSSVRTIENGIDVEMFSANPDERARVRKECAFPLRKVVIGLVANFRRNKNHMFLLKAFHEIARTHDDVTLVFVGQGFAGDPENSEPEISEYIAQHQLGDRVWLTGYRPDVQQLLRALDVFCLVSYKEGLPLSLIEAMASGLPVIGTDIDAIRNVVREGVNGLLVQPDDVPQLARALTQLVERADVRQQMGEESQRLARSKYSLTRCIDDTREAFLSISPRRADTLEASQSSVA